MRRQWILAILLIVLTVAMPVWGANQPGSLPTLFAKAGPGFDITLKDADGRKINRLAAGTYRILVTDRSGDDRHNFRLKGFGVSKATTVPFVGMKRWTVAFTRGKVYRFVCDPHAFVMHGRFTAV